MYFCQGESVSTAKFFKDIILMGGTPTHIVKTQKLLHVYLEYLRNKDSDDI